MATKQFEIYYRNLNKEAQYRYLNFAHVESLADLNHEIEPLAIIEIEDEENTLQKQF